MHSILLLPLVARWLETIDVYIWRMFVFMSVVVTVWGSVGMFFCVAAVVKKSFFSLGVLKYVVFPVCIVGRGTVGARVWGV